MKNIDLDVLFKQYVYQDSTPDFDKLWQKIESYFVKEEYMSEKKGGFKIFAWLTTFLVIAALGWFGLTKLSLIKKQEKVEKGEAIVVTLVVGEVKVKKMGASDWREVSVEDILQMGDAIKTASDSYCELQMVKKGVFRIESGTEVFLSRLISRDDKIDSRMKLSKGTLALKPKQLKQGESFEVETSTAVAAVRGTKFIVKVDDNGNTKVAVNEGRVAVVPVVKSIDEAKEKGLVSEKASEILHKEVVKPVEVKQGEEATLESKRVEELDKTLGKAIEQVAQKQQDKVISEETLTKVAEVKTSREGKKEEINVTESIVSTVQKEMRPVSKETKSRVEESVVSTVVEKQTISEESRKKMDALSEEKIISKASDMVKVKFDSVPSGAEVYVENNLIGLTPLEVILEKGKKLNIKITKQDYVDFAKEVTIDSGTVINATLNQVPKETSAEATEKVAETKKLPGELDWERPIAFKLDSAYKEPVDPVLYRGRIILTKSNRLYIISTEGKVLKSIAVVEEGGTLTRPVVSDGVVYVGSDIGGIYAYSISGEKLWQKDAGSEKYGAAPAAGYDMVAVPSIEKGIMIYSKKGELLDKISADSIYSAPLIVNKGKTLVYATESGSIVSYDIEKKTQNWTKNYNERFLYPLVGDETIVALIRGSGKVLAIKPSDGSIAWSATFEEIKKTKINPKYSDGKVILANNAEQSLVIVLNALNGNVLARISLSGEAITTPFVTENSVYFGTDSGKIYSYSLTAKKNAWTYKSSGGVSMVVADKEGIFAISSSTMYKLTK